MPHPVPALCGAAGAAAVAASKRPSPCPARRQGGEPPHLGEPPGSHRAPRWVRCGAPCALQGPPCSPRCAQPWGPQTPPSSSATGSASPPSWQSTSGGRALARLSEEMRRRDRELARQQAMDHSALAHRSAQQHPQAAQGQALCEPQRRVPQRHQQPQDSRRLLPRIGRGREDPLGSCLPPQEPGRMQAGHQTHHPHLYAQRRGICPLSKRAVPGEASRSEVAAWMSASSARRTPEAAAAASLANMSDLEGASTEVPSQPPPERGRPAQQSGQQLQHRRGVCTPCFFHLHDACDLGSLCSYCHEDHDSRLCKRQRAPRQMRLELRARLAARGR